MEPIARARRALLLLLATAPLAAQDAPAPKRITFEDLLGNKVRYQVSVPSARWVNDGTALEVREAGAEKTKGRDVVRDPRTWGPIEPPKTREAAAEPAKAARRASIDAKGQVVLTERDGTKRALTDDAAPKQEAHLSPDERWVSFVRDGDLAIRDLDGGEWRVTGDGAAPNLDGVLDWVYQEEVYGRGDFQGHWWSPAGGVVAYLSLDESAVRDFTVVDHAPRPRIDDDRTVVAEVSKYPKAGDPNPRATLSLAHLADRKTVPVDLSRYPEDRLVVRVGWTPTGDRLLFQVQDRVQTWLELVSADPATGASTTVLREESPAWVDVLGVPRWLDDGTFLWLSARSGHEHVYRYRIDGTLVGQVTTGEWPVREILRVDEPRGLVWFTASPESPIDEHVFRIGLDGQGLVQLTRGRGTHKVAFDRDANLFVDTVASMDKPAAVRVCSGDGEVLRTLEPLVPSFEFAHCQERLEVVKARDEYPLDVSIIEPLGFDAERGSYPVWIETYSGPGAPSVRNAWQVSAWEQFLAHQGFVLMQVNVRCASAAGRTAVATCHKRLGTQELADLEDAVRWLTGHRWADAARVGISGWSYGGFMTAYALTHSKLFKAGIAGAGVYDWQLYDTIYTERYMDTPQANAAGYAAASCIDAAKDLHGALLLVHGEMDDNVHLQNTIRFAGALQDAGKDFEMMVYPGSRHGVRSAHLQRLRWKFIQREMLGG